MKTPRSLPSLALALVAAFVFATWETQPALAQQAPTAKAVFDEGVKLFEEKRFAEALVKFEQVQRMAPNFVYARSYAARARTALNRGAGPDNRLEGQLAQLIVPEIEFREAPLGDILDFLSMRAEELSGGEIKPNFIYKGSSEQRQNTLVNLNLRNVPMTEVIRYVGTLSRTRFTYEAHAVVGEPMGAGAAPPASAPPADGTTSVEPEAQGPRTLFERP